MAARRWMNIEHARWAAWFDYAWIDWQYMPPVVGISQWMVFQPTFRIRDTLVLCCSRHPNNGTRIVAQAASGQTGLAVALIGGPMFRPHPDRDPPAPQVIYMPNQGTEQFRFFGGSIPRMGLYSRENAQHALTEPDSIRAYFLATQVNYEAIESGSVGLAEDGN